jgi:membrane protein implicated in regulation of membrane protease activity
MQHLILFLPMAGIVVFWLLPVDVAVTVYLLIPVVSGLFYWAIARAMKRRHKTGAEGLINSTARVVSDLPTGSKAKYVVRIQ